MNSHPITKEIKLMLLKALKRGYFEKEEIRDISIFLIAAEGKFDGWVEDDIACNILRHEFERYSCKPKLLAAKTSILLELETIQSKEHCLSSVLHKDKLLSYVRRLEKAEEQ